MCHEENVISWCVYVSSLLSCTCLAELSHRRVFEGSRLHFPPPSHSDQWVFYHLASHLNFAKTRFLVLTYFEVFRSCLPWTISQLVYVSVWDKIFVSSKSPQPPSCNLTFLDPPQASPNWWNSLMKYLEGPGSKICPSSCNYSLSFSQHENYIWMIFLSRPLQLWCFVYSFLLRFQTKVQEAREYLNLSKKN